MTSTVNDNENENVDTTSNYISNDNVDKYARERRIEVIADELLSRLRLGPESRPFMCKVARKLSEGRIWDNLEQAMKPGKVTNPIGLFIYLCKRDGV